MIKTSLNIISSIWNLVNNQQQQKLRKLSAEYNCRQDSYNDILNKTPTTSQQNIDSLIPASPITWQVNTSPFTKPNQQDNACYEDSIDWVPIHLLQPLKNCFMTDVDL